MKPELNGIDSLNVFDISPISAFPEYPSVWSRIPKSALWSDFLSCHSSGTVGESVALYLSYLDYCLNLPFCPLLPCQVLHVSSVVLLGEATYLLSVFHSNFHPVDFFVIHWLKRKDVPWTGLRLFWRCLCEDSPSTIASNPTRITQFWTIKDIRIWNCSVL